MRRSEKWFWFMALTWFDAISTFKLSEIFQLRFWFINSLSNLLWFGLRQTIQSQNFDEQIWWGISLVHWGLKRSRIWSHLYKNFSFLFLWISDSLTNYFKQTTLFKLILNALFLVLINRKFQFVVEKLPFLSIKQKMLVPLWLEKKSLMLIRVNWIDWSSKMPNTSMWNFADLYQVLFIKIICHFNWVPNKYELTWSSSKNICAVIAFSTDGTENQYSVR